MIYDLKLSRTIKARAEERTDFLISELQKNMSHVQGLDEIFWSKQRKTIFETIYDNEKLARKFRIDPPVKKS